LAGRQAKLLGKADFERVLKETTYYGDPCRSLVMVLLSVRAGLRAAEIAGLEWSMVLDASGKIGDVMNLEDRIAKKKSGRQIPIHRDLRSALQSLLKHSTGEGPVIKSKTGGHMKPRSIVNWFRTLYADLKLQGCSSHSGRRTFITRAARVVHRAGGSLRDVQMLAGHRSIEVTQRYIEGGSDIQRKLISLL
jgi:integrase/recombinase XerD